MEGMVDVCVGPMSTEDIGREISRYLNSCKKPKKLLVSIVRRDDGKFQTKIFMTEEDFKSNNCNYRMLCEDCLSTLVDTTCF